MKNKSTQQESGFPVVTCLIIIIIVAGVLFFSLTRKHNDNQSSGLTITQNDIVTVARVRLASAKNALDGTGEFTANNCNALKSLAKKYNNSSDYFSDCSEATVNLMYLSTPDTSNTNILRLSNEEFTATFVFTKGGDKLIDYSFENIKSAGYNKYRGRN